MTIPHLQPLTEAGRPLQDGRLRSYAAVFDGHNGAEAADIAAGQLHRLLAAEPALRDVPQGTTGTVAQRFSWPVIEALKRAFLKVRSNSYRNIGGMLFGAGQCFQQPYDLHHAAPSSLQLGATAAPWRWAADFVRPEPLCFLLSTGRSCRHRHSAA